MSVAVAPDRVTGNSKPWTGTVAKKPHEYSVQVVIPHIDTPEPVELAVELWRAQTVRPYITIIDTGSISPHRERIEALRADDVEVHAIACNGYEHPSQPVSIAQDVALAVCQQEYQFCTHSDVFPMRPDVLEWFVARCSSAAPAVGYEISPRDHVAAGWLQRHWRGLLGHTATMLHAPTIKRRGITWDYQRAMGQVELDASNLSDFDTEVGFGLLLRHAGVLPTIVGHDVNRKRQTDELIDHVRSHSSSSLYDPKYHSGNCSRWMGLAMAEARERLAAWGAE
jgi:hypothetical protein